VVSIGIPVFSVVGSGDKSSQFHKDGVLSSNRSGICTVPQIEEKMRRVTRQTVLRRIIVHSVHYPSEGRKCGLLVIKGVACGNTARTAPVTQASNYRSE
jgi:hypothetical protein